MKVIGFSGLPGSGKSTAIEAIRDLGRVITMGDVIRSEARKRNIVSTDENLGKIGKELRKTYGPQVIAEKCVDLIKSLQTDVIFVDGIRSIIEVKVFRREWKFPVIAIVLDEKERFKRLSTRARSDDPQNLNQFKERDERELKFGLESVIQNADYKINNNSSIEDLRRNTQKLVKEIIGA